MSRISNKELAESLTGKHGLSKQDAENFVAKMFDVLESGLQTDKQVKVKGLGTFKVVSVASRKSVDVNTGEPIVIEGRDKISFIPDPAMRDNVNRPFSQFETVVLNDGVDFSAIDKKYEESENEDIDPKEEQVMTVEAENGQEEESIEKKEELIEEEATPSAVPIQAKNDIEEDSPQKEIYNSPTDSVENTSTEETPEVETENTTEVETENTTEVETENTTEEVPENAPATVRSEVETEEDVEKEAYAAQHRTLKYVCIAAAIIIILLGASAIYLYNQLQLRDHRIENLEAQMLERKGKKTQNIRKGNTATVKNTQTITSGAGAVVAQEARTATSNNVTHQESVAKVTDKEGKMEADNEAANKNNKKENTIIKDDDIASNNYNKDPRIRTGAYNIVGIDHTVTAREGQTLLSISRSQLGPGMECYVEAVNNGRTEFKAGEKVNIPKLKLKRKR